MIAMALALAPELLIADEPTTALDVTIQAQILDLMRDMQEKLGTSVILITHDLGVIAEMADRVAVMYAGRIVEESSVNDLFDQPAASLHPGPDRIHPGAGEGDRQTGCDPRIGAQPGQSAARLPVCAALPFAREIRS